MPPSTWPRPWPDALRMPSLRERALAGRTVVVTRPTVGTLGPRLADRGAAVEHVPLIAIGPPSDGGVALDAALAALGSFDWLGVTSSKGADRVGAAARAPRGRSPSPSPRPSRRGRRGDGLDPRGTRRQARRPRSDGGEQRWAVGGVPAAAEPSPAGAGRPRRRAPRQRVARVRARRRR